MINLIPPDARKAIRREYWIRVVSVWMILLGAALLMIALLKIPTLVLVSTQLDAFSIAYIEAQEQDKSLKEAEAKIKRSNEIALVLVRSTNDPVFIPVVEALDTLAGEDVKIFNFVITQERGQLSTILIIGNASTRISLARFSDSVEAHPRFLEADVPISNLAKDKDINFSITIIPEKSQ